MGKFTKRLVPGIAALLAMSVGASADVLIDDFSGGTNQNLMGQYWYYYTNLATKGGPGNAHINEWNLGSIESRNYGQCAGDLYEVIEDVAATNGTLGQLNYEMVFRPSNREQRPNGGPLNAVLAFSNLNAEEDPCYPGVGMGTNLVKDLGDGSVPEPIGDAFATVTHINFYAKTSHPDAVIKFKVETASQLRHIESPETAKKLANAAYESVLNFTGTGWQRFEIAVSGPCRNPEPVTGSAQAQAIATALNAACVGDLQRAAWEVPGGMDWHYTGSTTNLSGQGNGAKAHDFVFDIKDAVKIAWFVQGQDWQSPSGETVYLHVDSVWTTGGDFKLPGDCPECVTEVMTPPDGKSWLLSDFEQILFQPSDGGYGYLSQNRLGGPWYAYNDEDNAGSNASQITAGLWYDPMYLLDADGNRCDEAGVGTCKQGGRGLNIEGYTVGDVLSDGVTIVDIDMIIGEDLEGFKPGYGQSNGALINFTMGPGWTEGVEDISGFVGIGTKFTEDSTASFNARTGVTGDAGEFTGEVTGVWFMYRTDADMKNLIVSVVDRNAVDNPDAVHSARIPGSGGVWKAASIPFSVLAVPSWSNWNIAINLEQLVELQFRFDGPEGTTGFIQIDNVYLTNDNPQVGIKLLSSTRAAAPALRASYSRGSINVNWNASTRISNGKISLVNIKGVTVASQPVRASGSNISARLATRGGLPTGMYFVRIDARDVNGKRIVQQVPVNIVK